MTIISTRIQHFGVGFSLKLLLEVAIRLRRETCCENICGLTGRPWTQWPPECTYFSECFSLTEHSLGSKRHYSCAPSLLPNWLFLGRTGGRTIQKGAMLFLQQLISSKSGRKTETWLPLRLWQQSELPTVWDGGQVGKEEWRLDRVSHPWGSI